MESTVSDTDALLWRVSKTSRTEYLILSEFVLAVSELLLPWANFFSREWFAFVRWPTRDTLQIKIFICNDSILFAAILLFAACPLGAIVLLPWQLTHSENVSTRAKRNPVKAAREGSIIFRFETPTSRKSAKCNRKTRRFWLRRINIGRSRVSISHGRKHGLDSGLADWNLDYPLCPRLEFWNGILTPNSASKCTPNGLSTLARASLVRIRNTKPWNHLHMCTVVLWTKIVVEFL